MYNRAGSAFRVKYPKLVSLGPLRGGNRTDGKFLYGDAIVPGITWPFGLDPAKGRPKVNPAMITESGGPEVGPIIPSLEGGND